MSLTKVKVAQNCHVCDHSFQLLPYLCNLWAILQIAKQKVATCATGFSCTASISKLHSIHF